jgi:DNA-binding phage protein
MNHNQQILQHITQYTKDNGYEPEITTIHKDTGISRVNIYKAFKELKQSGDIEELKPCRSKQYRLSTGS